MNDKQDIVEGQQRACQVGAGITRRNMLRGLGVAAAAAPVGMAASVAAEDAPPSSTIPPATDLLDEQFTSASGRHFGSQLIHHGEQKGYQVTPISQDKAAPGYQRPCGRFALSARGRCSLFLQTHRLSARRAIKLAPSIPPLA